MHKYRGFLVEQQAGTDATFLVFVANAKEITTWAHADNIKLDRGNVQRALVDARWRQIKRFFGASLNNVIPTSVTIAFDEGLPHIDDPTTLTDDVAGYSMQQIDDDLWELTLSNAVQDHTYILDGQHRLRGMAEVEAEIPVPVCLFPSMSKLERAFQFVTINNKSHKVPTDNLKALIANFDMIEIPLRDRLTQASVTVPRFATFVDVLNEDPESPFYKMVNWVNNRFPGAEPVVQPTALENSLKAITRAFPETKEDESDALSVLYAIWKAIFATYGITADNAGRYPNLVLKATIQSLSEMIVDQLKAQYDIAFNDHPIMGDDGKSAGDAARNLMTGVPAEFWQDVWALKSLDTSAGRDIIQDDLRRLKKLVRGTGRLPADWKAQLAVYRIMDDD
ncbi:MAG: DGQHR domain-containing protein [Brevundimonas sp.]|uniref:DGQHR domain-containing protein n=1 Tax=Brevundimonas sp. TaxID=1871086 RepID=UPI001A20D928|nr:DGQHR domain-containing protein [Brevundimonas sp.]MBJ7446239.1 DGQHR domain-containing protein [Brevundimonas sp.]